MEHGRVVSRGGSWRQAGARSQASSWLRRLGPSLGWLAVVAVMLVAGVRDSEARLHPYYVLRSASNDIAIKPRILFVLDTSGSMGNQSKLGLTECLWEECEDPAFQGTLNEGRMAAARRVIREAVTATGDNAKFALMTFDQNHPHRNNRLPDMCEVGGVDQRFLWVDTFYYTNAAQSITRDGHIGVWRLCQGRQIRPYSYLRWDDMGIGSPIAANNQVGDVPPSPMVSKVLGDVTDVSNAHRKVQWFPKFVGVRFQPNATTDPTHEITYESTGDYGINDADKDANVWGNDFYYWPYVDGFPGYANFRLEPYHSSGTNPNYGGIAASQSATFNAGKLFAPFYLDLAGTGIADDAFTPDNEEEAFDAVITNTSSIIEGGVDAAGVTPWFSTIGDVPVVPPQSNALYSHETVAGYLAFVNQVSTADVCAPAATVLITDGQPHPAASEGGWPLYERLAALRTDLKSQVYVIGFFLNGNSQLNEMACAGAGACDGGTCSTPCDDTPAKNWDTCADPLDPLNHCAFEAESSEELHEALNQIISQIGDFDIPSGAGSSTNEFGVALAGDDELEALQTSVSAATEFPSWRGHVTRELCDHRDSDGVLLPACVDVPFQPEEVEESFGVCPQQRTWDAGQCLADNPWETRRLYTHKANNELILIADSDGSASGDFLDELQTQNIITAVGAEAEAQADEIAAFLLGRDAPDGWRLPGLANSAPITVRRIPPYDGERVPSVGIRDPHCGGRLLGAADGVPESMEEYAQEAWDTDELIGMPSPHYESQEAVIIGDDFGVLHAFQFNSGNELWGFVPRFALESLAQKAAIGAASYGQTGGLDDHNYGLAATINKGWVYDDSDADPALHRWRQLAIMGMGPGGREHMVLDLSHMSPVSPRGPFEIMWTTEDAGLKASYDQYNGETWARPALGYHVPGETSTQIPDAFFVMGSGYPMAGGAEEGRTLLQVDALTGAIVDYAVLPVVAPADVYEPSYGTVVDPAVGTHCLSRLWAEMQEVYIADPAGRLFRWDLGRETAHEADSTGTWGHAAQMAISAPIPACEGAGDSCIVDASNRAETFTFPPAVTSNNRLDNISSTSTGGPLAPSNQFLLALVGGDPADDSLGSGTGQPYQSSIYILVDDHAGDASGGFAVPDGAPKAPPGDNDQYMRIPFTDIERTRTFIPYAGASEITDPPRNFTRGTRPIRAPRIFVTGVVDQSTVGGEEPPTVIDDVEVYYIEFTVYEPPDEICDSRFYDATEDEWHQDPGSSYVLTFRLTADVASGFDLINGAGGGGGGGGGGGADFGGGFDTGLVLDSVVQQGTGDCANGGCGPQLSNPAPSPCDNNAGGSVPRWAGGAALTINHNELSGFTPVE